MSACLTPGRFECADRREACIENNIFYDLFMHDPKGDAQNGERFYNFYEAFRIREPGERPSDLPGWRQVGRLAGQAQKNNE